MTHYIYIYRDKKNLGYNKAKLYIEEAVEAALLLEGFNSPAEINVMLCDDDKIKELNLRFRNIDKATDVLSFPMQYISADSLSSEKFLRNPENNAVLLGDIVISLERCVAQATEYESYFKKELQYLTVHSVLHLLSYDHKNESDKNKMRAREKQIMKKLYGDLGNE